MNHNQHIKKIENYEGYLNLFCIDESLKDINPTGTFKDKQPQALEILLKKFPNMPIAIGAMSTGNTAYSLLYFAQKYNQRLGAHRITPVIYIPMSLEKRAYFGPDTNGLRIDGKSYIKLLEDLVSEAEGKVISLDFGKVGDKSKNYLSSLRLARVAKQENLIKDEGLYLNITEGLENTIFLTLEQISTLTEEDYDKLPKLGIKAYQPIIVKGLEELKNKFNVDPDYVICQFGAGILFNEIRYYLKANIPKAKVIPIAVGDPESCADKIYASYWTVSPNSLRGMGKTQSRHDGSVVYGVEDWEIGRALTALKGVLNAEASGIAGFSILHRLEEIAPELNRKKHTVVTINTGNGLPNFI